MVDGSSLNPGTVVQRFAVLGDGGLILSARHTNNFGQSASQLLHLQPNGVLNPGFSLIADREIHSIVPRADGHILVGGNFTTLDGQARSRIARLRPDGTLAEALAAYFNLTVYSLAVQSDGKVLVGGDFTQVQGQNRYHLARLNADGQLDVGFNAIVDGQVNLIALQQDGAILIAGGFYGINGVSRSRIARLHADGSVDLTFNPGVANPVSAMHVAPDGRIYVAGSFSTIAGVLRPALARLNPDGTLDATFSPAVSGYVDAIALQANGELLAGGSFTAINGLPRNRFAKLDPEGNTVTGFELELDGDVRGIGLRSDGGIFLRGGFATIQGQPRTGFAILSNPVPAAGNLLANETTVTYLHEGSSPQLSWINFSHSPDGLTWNLLGTGVPVAGGWQLTLPELPVGGTLRAYGQGHAANHATWETEIALGPPAVVSQPSDTSQLAGTPTFFRASVVGSEPQTYQWFQGDAPLVDDAQVSGANTATLILREVYGADAGNYHLTVTNPAGTITSEPATLTVTDPWIREQPQPAFAESGLQLTLSLAAVASEPVAFHWLKDGVPVALTETRELSLPGVTPANTGAYTVVVSNRFGIAISNPFQVTINGAPLDQGFQADADGYVEAITFQADGKILIGGTFTTVGGKDRRHVARLLADGTVDESFQVTPAPTSIAPYVNSIAVQEDGNILLAGRFESINGQPRGRVARLLPTGVVDPAFAPFANDWIFAVLPLKNNQVIIGGSFTNVNGMARSRIARLNEDGSMDTTFNASASDWTQCVVQQPDGKLLVGGNFTFFNNLPRPRIVRLNSNGSLDTTFNTGASGLVRTIVLQADGKILVGGSFTNLGGEPRSRIGRLNPDGSVDLNFNPSTDLDVESIVLQADGAILLGGRFTTVNGQPVGKLARLHPDGTLDSTVNADLPQQSWVTGVALQPDGDILVGGNFHIISGFNRLGLARLDNPVPAHQEISSTASSLHWQRSGATPETLDCTFSHSADGNQWTELGAGVRVVGGWELTGITPPVGGALRATGRVSGGRDGMATWMISSYSGAPGIVAQPWNLHLDFGTAGQFSVIVGGEEEFEYQWYKDGTPLLEEGSFTDTTSPTLFITNAAGLDRGSFHVVVQSPHGTTTSLGAQLFVNDPIIAQHPANQFGSPGGTALLEGEALGSGTILYHWLKDDVTVAQTTEPKLELSQLSVTDAGYYYMVASNVFGAATTKAALLTVNGIMPDSSFAPTPNGEVAVMALQSDRRILIGGDFTTVTGQPRERLARLYPDGSLDPRFDATANGEVRSIVLQPDGRILLAGQFDQINGQARSRLARIHADGTLDESFNPGANGEVEAVVLQPDGKILVGGRFTTLAGASRSRIGRLDSDGTIDTDFNPGAGGGFNPHVLTLCLQSDGRIIVGGAFTSMAGQVRNRIARLNTDGTLNTTFNPSADGSVTMLLPQADGTVLVGGEFGTIGGIGRNRLARLLLDGTVDTAFHMQRAMHGAINSLALQTDGGVVIAGSFYYSDSGLRRGIARLLPDGRIDGTFDPTVEFQPIGAVRSVLLQPDGSVVVAGGIKSIEGAELPYLAKLLNSAASDSQLVADETAVRWFRNGPAPEVENASFEVSADGNSWSLLGEGTPMIGGWEITDLGEAPDGHVRVRGLVRSENSSGQSGWYLEARSGGRWIFGPPSDDTVEFGEELTLSVFSEGPSPATYQWYYNGQILTDNGRLLGSQSYRLRVANVSGADAGAYHVVVSGPDGDSTSPPALVTVLDPMIITPPLNQFGELGESVTLAAGVSGTGPMGFRWYRDEVFVAETSVPEFELQNLAGTDSGAYRVEANNIFGSAQSAAGRLTVRVTRPNELALVDPAHDVYALAIQADGKILLAGNLSTIEGQPRQGVARLWPDGALDPSFNAGPLVGESPAVLALSVLSDGSVLAGGYFLEIGGQVQWALARLHSDGSLAESFNPAFDLGMVYSMVIQPDEKIVVGGFLPSLEGVGVSNIVRLLPTGIRDTTFQSGANELVYSLALQEDGKIIAGGRFTSISGHPRERIARMHADGSLDQTFSASTDNTVNSIVVQPNGRILLSGSFTMVNGVSRGHVARLNADGTLDMSFDPNVRSASSFYGATALMLQADGKILVGGDFTSVGGMPRVRLARLFSDGTVDESFSPEPDNVVLALTVSPSGSILAGGFFSKIGGVLRRRLAEFNSTDLPVQVLRHEASLITWERSGGGPELSRVQFEATEDGIDWTILGTGERTETGWQLNGASLPGRGTLRARGWVNGGRFSGSNWLLDDYLALGDFSVHAFSLNLEVMDDSSRLRINGETGLSYQVDYSAAPDRPETWHPLPPFVLTNSIHLISEPVDSRNGQRFYRARLKQ